MKIFVCIKQVPDTETKIKLNADKSFIDTTGVKWVMNPYDEYAVEEALKYKQAHPQATVTAVSLGPKKRVIETLRTALAMGADDGIAIDAPESLDSYVTAKALAKAISGEGVPHLIFTGKLAIDDNASSVSQQLAEFLGLPHATVVSKFEAKDNQYQVEREVEGGSREIVQLFGPSIIAANKGLNQPRYASLPGIMKAKKKPLKELDLKSLGVDESEKKLDFVDYMLPPEKPPVKFLDGDVQNQVQSLTKLLREEAKVI
ncbi:MAG: electron transfer flavoprotein subunit beta/FixA family protein [Bdellovibrionaceae bacterium]|nr:electron transfer flavoprotein subunit beta/FixA family protein [Pseudobdellovibrionaceae bacterium]